MNPYQKVLKIKYGGLPETDRKTVEKMKFLILRKLWNENGWWKKKKIG
jgi:hypothetical protein